MTHSVRRANAGDVASAESLVADAGLPTDGLAELVGEPHVLLVAVAETAVIGCVGLEAHGDQRLLRSLAVSPEQRGTGVGAALVRRALDIASPHDVVLLTESARAFFAHLEFRDIDRAAVTGPVTASAEWTRLCPSTAVAMTAPRGD